MKSRRYILESTILARLEKFASSQMSIREAQAQRISVHFATSLDLCHLNRSELATHLQTYRGRVLLRTSDSRHNVSTFWDGWKSTRCRFCVHPSKMKDASKECPTVSVRLPRNHRPADWDKIKDSVVSLDSKLSGCGILSQRKLEKILLQEIWKTLRMFLFASNLPSYSCQYTLTPPKMVGSTDMFLPIWAKLRRKIDLQDPTPFIDR